MKLTQTHERILIFLISLHSFIVGMMLLFAADWAVRFAGWAGADPIFFIWQAGAFHFVLATGYNGPPAGLPHCDVTGCVRQQQGIPTGERHELCRGIHAEQNAIIQAAFHGVSIRSATLYCTNLPCSICAKMIINAGLKIGDPQRAVPIGPMIPKSR